MRLAVFILLPWLAFSQTTEDYWVVWNGEYTTPYQRDFAAWCCEYGAENGDRGHTLMWLGKNETSWNVVVGADGGRSLGPFGMLESTALWVAKKMDIDIEPENIRVALDNDRELAADMALWYFDYWYKKHLEEVGHRQIAWIRAVKSYRYGYWPEKASDKFTDAANAWVRFFKTLCE